MTNCPSISDNCFMQQSFKAFREPIAYAHPMSERSKLNVRLN